jgi:F0F1-type ATP synthase assembly protein I
MAKDDPELASEDDDGASIAIPSHDTLPSPPEIQFTRPTFGGVKSGSSYPGQSDKAGSHSEDSGTGTVVSLGAGLAGSAAFGSSLIVGLILGQLIDHKFHTTPWGMIVMTLLGVGAGFTTLYRLMIAHGVRKK